MFQLVLSISLGLLLLFVLLLLLSELVTTYPVWKQFKNFYSTQSAVLAPRDEKTTRRQNLLILLVACAGLIFLLAYVQQKTKEEKSSAVKAEKTTAVSAAKRFTASSSDGTVFFRLHTKWEAGKLYGNSTITFATGAVKPLADCRYHFLDGDGFLIKAVSFTSNDFVLSTAPDGKVQGLLHQFNTELNSNDYLKIENLQVVVDNKVPAAESF